MQNHSGRTAYLVAALGVLALLQGCEGDQGEAGGMGPAGPPGPPGPPGSGATVGIENAQAIAGVITGVTVPGSGQPVVQFALADELQRPVRGLLASQISFVVARLAPGQNGRSSEWRAYIYRTENPGPAGPGTQPVTQATTEAATTGQFVDNGDGTYQYTFAKNITNDATVPYDATLTHRVGYEIRGLAPAMNAVYTFQPSSGATSGIFSREIVDNDTCNACHDQLAFHGGARFDTRYCVMCHSPQSFDAQSGNTVDMKVMIHKIHRGSELPSVQPATLPAGVTDGVIGLGLSYGIYGRGGLVDFSHIVYPQDHRNCTTCHEETDADTPEASNYRITVNSVPCGACHDATTQQVVGGVPQGSAPVAINFQTGQGHSAANLAVQDQDCVTCHGPDATINNGLLRTAKVHEIPEKIAAQKFKYSVVSVANTAPGQNPTVTIKVTDPTNGDAPYDITDPAGPFRQSSSALTVDVAWNTVDFNNRGSGSAPTPTSGTPALPVRITFANGTSLVAGVTNNFATNGTFSATATIPVPAFMTGSGAAILEGRPRVDANGDGTLESLPVAASGLSFVITDASPQARRQVVELTRCNECHNVLSLHGGNRTDNTELCTTCHNPNNTDISRRGAPCSNLPTDPVAPGLGPDDMAIDFKFMIHQIHSANFQVCGFGNSVNDFTHVGFPGQLNNCEGCHRPDTYYPVDGALVQATTFDAGDRTTLADDRARSPNATACSGCHTDALARTHMEQNGGDFNAGKTVEGTIISAGTETCALCHGPGRIADVKLMHGVGQ